VKQRFRNRIHLEIEIEPKTPSGAEQHHFHKFEGALLIVSLFLLQDF
jgi:hypothetical protein